MLFTIYIRLQVMPVAIMTPIIDEKYGGDSLVASQCVFITTIISEITILIMILFL
ncbi:hypothetical protein [Clostridium psychrophilum]|uniref:hypothetical protein n=1 Tax=Clostridium psychrophilum TaxID=132926 RepID=UPI001C0E5F2B|nr:hypothetical protein [Clostridium psychrophilum]MBU3180797.1 hypothetical protein [Clostridium psychrophilum]